MSICFTVYEIRGLSENYKRDTGYTEEISALGIVSLDI